MKPRNIIAGVVLVGLALIILRMYGPLGGHRDSNGNITLQQLPAIPVAVSFRKALMGSGDVAVIKNNSGQTMAVRVTITRTGVTPWDKSIVIDSGKGAEVGSMQGWVVAPGDVVEVSANGFQPSKTRLQ